MAAEVVLLTIIETIKGIFKFYKITDNKPIPNRYFSICLPRYGLFDFEYMHQCQGTTESSKKQKLFLMSWCPDTAKVSPYSVLPQNSTLIPLSSSLAGQKEDVVLFLVRCAEEGAGGRAEIHPGHRSVRGVPRVCRGEVARHRSPVSGRDDASVWPGPDYN